MMAARARPRLPALRLGAPLAALREARGAARVLATFRRSAYLEVAATWEADPRRPQDRGASSPGLLPAPARGRPRGAHAARVPGLVALTTPGLEPGPFDVAVAGFETLRAALLAGPDTICLDGGVLAVGDVEVDLHAGALWNPRIPRPRGPGGAPWTPEARAAVEQVLCEAAPGESLAGLLREEHCRPGSRLEPVARALEVVGGLLRDPARAARAGGAGAVAASIAGRGPGLTPSGDDLLCGILLATWVWPGLVAAGRADELRAHLAGAAIPRTTRVGAAYLAAARRGWAPRPWHRLVHCLHDAAGARDAAVRVLAIGETSGADALSGFCWAWRRLPA